MTAKKQVAIVEDDPVFLHVLREALETEGYSVTSVTDSGLMKFLYSTEVTDFDLLLMDVKLPREDGDVVTGTLIKPETMPMKVTVLLISGLEEEELKLRAKQARADGYICKSWGLKRIVARIRETLEGGTE